MTPESFGHRLKGAMALARVSNREMAKRLGVNEKTVSYWRSDQQIPREETLAAIVELLRSKGRNVTVASLLYGESQPAVAEREPEYALALPHDAHVWLRAVLKYLADTGCTAREVDHAERLLRSEDLRSFIAVEGPPGALERALYAAAAVIVAELAFRGYSVSMDQIPRIEPTNPFPAKRRFPNAGGG